MERIYLTVLLLATLSVLVVITFFTVREMKKMAAREGFSLLQMFGRETINLIVPMCLIVLSNGGVLVCGYLLIYYPAVWEYYALVFVLLID